MERATCSLSLKALVYGVDKGKRNRVYLFGCTYQCKHQNVEQYVCRISSDLRSVFDRISTNDLYKFLLARGKSVESNFPNFFLLLIVRISMQSHSKPRSTLNNLKAI